MIGLILSFSYLCGKTFREREYSLEFAPVHCHKKIIGALCTWYTWDDEGKLIKWNKIQYSFANIDCYKATLIVSPNLDNTLWCLDEGICSELNARKQVTKSNLYIYFKVAIIPILFYLILAPSVPIYRAPRKKRKS